MMGAVTCNQLHEIDRAIDALLSQQCPGDFDSWWRLIGDAIAEGVPKGTIRTWSESGDNFDERAFEAQYRSLSNRPSTGRTGMLFKKARNAGWVDRNPGKRPSVEDIEARKKLAADVEAKAASAKAKRHADAEKRVEKLLEGTGAPSPDLPQLKGKKVGVHGDLRFLPEFELRYVDEKTGKWCSHIERDVVAIPIRTERDKITSLQLLFTSKNNPTGENKYFLPGGRTAGGYFVIGRVATTTKEIDVVEGYTTGASIFDAQAVGGTSSETAVMVAFSAGNLAAVAKGIRLKLGDGVKIVFGADNDQWKECNTGVEAAKAAARAVGGYLAIPPFEPNEHTGVDEKGRPIGPTDWNDWHLKNGLENVAFHIRKSIEAGPFVAEHGADEAAIDRAAGFAQIASEEGPAPEQPAENAEAVAESAVQTQAVVKERKLKIVTAPLIERVEPAAYSLGGASDSGLPASVISEATGSIDALGASSELGIIPLGVLSDMYAFWRIDTGTLELIQSDAVAKEASFLRLSSKQGWEIWCQGGPGKYDKSFIANAIVQTSKHLGPMNLGLVPVSMASPEKVNEAYAQAMLSKKQSPGMAAQMLSAHPGWKKAGIWFNVFANEIQITNEPPCMGGAGTWSDHHDVLLCGWVSSQWGVTITTKCAAEAITALAMQDKRHPVRDYLSGLKWDGKKRLDTWLINLAGAHDDNYTRAVGAKTLIGAVARVMDPGCKLDTVLILEGEQGKQKSSLVASLMPDDSWFTEDLGADIGTKDAMSGLAGKWIVELAELSNMAKSETNAIKSFITRRTDRYRPSYGHRSIDFPRQAVLIGTVNPEGDGRYLRDPTGARRFWPVACGIIKLDKAREVRDQLWAEAVVRFNKNEQWWLTGEEETAAKKAQEERQEDNPWVARVGKYLSWLTPAENSGEWGGLRAKPHTDFTTSDVFEAFYRRPISDRETPEGRKIAAALKEADWVQVNRNRPSTNIKCRFWVAAKNKDMTPPEEERKAA